ncbi:MAG: ribonuclease H-like domain-containing protein [Sedimentibacter sp.]|uniref:ribonuclease H-like domain-containing protein n=1 Tax=Sedimentibacter sp. TaxID=1960295 RepID=UPI0029817BA2|nr:ribonuclease H-like domain-containing protein [Sedimentibacter sp.]MDW5300519.1 ribonuclease H-like domain-containing protein [Sedimentibacter sp.]
MIVNNNEVETISNDKNINELLKESFFLDIETTGLSRQFSDIISITVLLYESGKYKIYQIFCQYKVDEPEALKLLKDLIKSKKYVITYNGNIFDIPFLVNKTQKHNIDIDFDCFIKIDLYNYMRQLRNKIQITDLKLKTIEEYFNIKRNDTLGGEDVIVLYEAYKIEPRKEFSYLIMQHNYEDVFNLPILLNSIFNLYDDIWYFNNLIVKINNHDFIIKKNSLICKLYIISSLKNNYIHQGINFDLDLKINTQTMEINIPVGFYKDNNISEFYYVNNNEYKIISYTAIEGIKKNLVPIKLNDKIYYENIKNIVKSIITSIF